MTTEELRELLTEAEARIVELTREMEARLMERINALDAKLNGGSGLLSRILGMEQTHEVCQLRHAHARNRTWEAAKIAITAVLSFAVAVLTIHLKGKVP
jgi:hypothetical protein